MKKLTLNLLLAGIIASLSACNSGASQGTASTSPTTNQSNQANGLPFNVVKGSSLTPTSIKVNIGADTPQTTSTFLNPVMGWVVSTAEKAALGPLESFGSGLINSAISQLYGLFGISTSSGGDPQYMQIENQLANVNQQLSQIDIQLNSFISNYDQNVANTYNQHYTDIDTYVFSKYTTAANQIYSNVPDGYDQSSLEESWVIGTLPVYSVESAIQYNASTLNSNLSTFDPTLLQNITDLSDDSGDSYFNADGSFTLTQTNGVWTSSPARQALVSPMFYTSLQDELTNFKKTYPDYGDTVDNPNGTPQNYLYNKSLWTQLVMRALYSNQVALQRTYRIVDFLIDAKYGPAHISSIDLPGFFMGNHSTNYAMASNYLTAIYQYKSQNIYNEAINAINLYQTGPKNADIANFTASSTCDDISKVGQSSVVPNSSNSHDQISVQTFINESASYGWDGKNLTTKCLVNSNPVKGITTTQDIGDMCGFGSGPLTNLNGHLYCSLGPIMNINALTQANIVINGTENFTGFTAFVFTQSSYDTVDVRNISGDTVIANQGTSEGHLYTVNDTPGFMHLRDGDPKNNYFAILQDSNHMYVYGEASSGEIFLQCLPYDKYCTVASPTYNTGRTGGQYGMGELLFAPTDGKYDYIQLMYGNNANSFDFAYGVQ